MASPLPCLRDWAVPAAFEPPSGAELSPGSWCSARWQPSAVAALAAHLDEHGAEALAALSLERRIAAWASAIEALLDPESDERRALVASLVATARLSPEGLSEALEVVLGGADGEVALRLARELPPNDRRASRRPLAGVVLAANVPGLVVQSLLPALLLGRPLLVRSSTREPLFAPALLGALARREPALGEAFAALSWPSEDPALFRAAFARADRVIAYGGAPALEALGDLAGDLVGELGPRLVALGPRASIAFVAGEFDPIAEGRRLARDVALLDQRGCLSVQAVWVEGGPQEVRAFAEALAWGLALESRRLPLGPVEPEVAARVQQLRGEAELRGALIGRLEPREGTVLLTEADGFLPVPGMRTVRVHPMTSLDAALERLGSERDRLQGAALIGDRALARGEEIAARLALARIAPAGRLQHAEAGWRSGGVDPLEVLG